MPKGPSRAGIFLAPERLAKIPRKSTVEPRMSCLWCRKPLASWHRHNQLNSYVPCIPSHEYADRQLVNRKRHVNILSVNTAGDS